MHETLERTQVSSTPVVEGSLKVYLALLTLAFAVASPSSATRIACALVFSGLAYHAAGRRALRLLTVPVTFLLPALAVVLVFASGGQTIASVWVLSITEVGLSIAIDTGLRSVASLSVLAFLVLTTPVPELFAALVIGLLIATVLPTVIPATASTVLP